MGKVARGLGFDVVSLDRDMEADIKTDIVDWDYTQLEPKAFDIIWASPPCTEYSRAKTTGVRDIEGANKILRAASSLNLAFYDEASDDQLL